jgi:biopolymer transport protein TolR
MITQDKNHRAKSKIIAEINMIPFIDIMLVILIVFMINTCAINYGIELQLPKIEHKVSSIANKNNIVIISIKPDGEFELYQNDANASIKSVKLQEILSIIKSYKSNHTNMQVVIQGDATTNYENVAKLIAGIQYIGINNVGLLTDPYDEKSVAND